jgi:hypothetical protein
MMPIDIAELTDDQIRELDDRRRRLPPEKPFVSDFRPHDYEAAMMDRCASLWAGPAIEAEIQNVIAQCGMRGLRVSREAALLFIQDREARLRQPVPKEDRPKVVALPVPERPKAEPVEGPAFVADVPKAPYHGQRLVDAQLEADDLAQRKKAIGSMSMEEKLQELERVAPEKAKGFREELIEAMRRRAGE